MTTLRLCLAAAGLLATVLVPMNTRAQGKEVPVMGGHLAVGIPNLLALGMNHAVNSGTGTIRLGTKLFASPLRYDQTWTLEPYLARHWQLSDDGLSLTLSLARNAVFHDGVPITARDVRFSIAVIRQHHPFGIMFEAVERVDTPDDHTAIIRFSRPVAAMLTMMTPPFLPIIPEHVYGDGQNISNHPANWQPVGSGPFRFVSLRQRSDDEVEINLRRHDAFFIEGRPYLDTLTVVAYGDNSRMMIPLEYGEIQIGSFADETDFATIEAVEHLAVSTRGNEALGPLVWLAFNLRRPPLDDVRVRRAFAYAIDRTIIHDVITRHRGAIATGPIAPGSPFYTNDVERYDVDVARANALLDAAGLPRDETGVRFAMTLSYVHAGGGYLFQEIAEYLSQDLARKIGIQVQLIHTQSFKTWAQRIANWDFDLTIDLVFNWGDPMIGVHRTYDSTNIRKGVIWSNTQGYRNPIVDSLMSLAGQTLAFHERSELYREFQRTIMQDVPIYPLIMVPYAIVYERSLKGVFDSVWGLYAPLDTVYWGRGRPGQQ